LEVDQDNIVQDCLNQIIGTKPPKANPNRFDPLKARLEIRFKNQPGIDAGALSKEFFQALLKELFNPNYGMFTANDSH